MVLGTEDAEVELARKLHSRRNVESPACPGLNITLACAATND